MRLGAVEMIASPGKRAAPTIALVLGLLGASAPGVALAQPRPNEAEARFGRGTELHRQGRFAEAAEEFLAAWRLSHRTELLYNAYVAYRDAADTRRASEALREYLDVEPRARNRPMLQAQLAAMDAQLRAATPTPAPAPAPAAAATPAAPAATVATVASVAVRPPAPTEPPRRSLALPIALISGGGVAVLAGAVLGVTVLSTESDLSSSCVGHVCDPALRGEADAARTRAVVTDVLLGVGLAAAVAGVIVLLGSRGDAHGPVVGAACAPGGCSARLHVTF